MQDTRRAAGSSNSTLSYPMILTPDLFPFYLHSQFPMSFPYPWLSEPLPYIPRPSAIIPDYLQMFYPFLFNPNPFFSHSSQVPMTQNIQLHSEHQNVMNHNVPMEPQTYHPFSLGPYIHDVAKHTPILDDNSRKHSEVVVIKKESNNVPGEKLVNRLPIKKRKIYDTQEQDKQQQVLKQKNLYPEDKNNNYPSTLMVSIAELLSTIEEIKQIRNSKRAHFEKLKRFAEVAMFAPAAKKRRYTLAHTQSKIAMIV
ncbi:hypothetical protein B566_EDAN014328 [Ephemera danica]|nr:hypothetical protein B566_EDAN014328 [Ephemera danica]